MSDPDRIAGDRWRTTSQIIQSGFAVKALASHITWMLGDNEWHRPVWRGRKIPPDGKTFETETFKDYLLLPSREGLDLPSLLTVHKLCEADPKRGAAAIAMLRREIGEEYDNIVDRERNEVRGAVELKAVGRPTGDNVDNVNIRPAPEGGNSATYLARRLKRDHPEIAAAIERGEYPSIRAAALAAGIVKPPSPFKQLCRLWEKAGPELRTAFLNHINRS